MRGRHLTGGGVHRFNGDLGVVAIGGLYAADVVHLSRLEDAGTGENRRAEEAVTATNSALGLVLASLVTLTYLQLDLDLGCKVPDLCDVLGVQGTSATGRIWRHSGTHAKGAAACHVN